MSDTASLNGKVLRVTDLAFQFEPEGEGPVWIPFSQLVDPDEKYIRDVVGLETDIEIKSWLARKLGL